MQVVVSSQASQNNLFTHYSKIIPYLACDMGTTSAASCTATNLPCVNQVLCAVEIHRVWLDVVPGHRHLRQLSCSIRYPCLQCLVWYVLCLHHLLWPHLMLLLVAPCMPPFVIEKTAISGGLTVLFVNVIYLLRMRTGIAASLWPVNQ